MTFLTREERKVLLGAARQEGMLGGGESLKSFQKEASD